MHHDTGLMGKLRSKVLWSHREKRLEGGDAGSPVPLKLEGARFLTA